MGAEWSCPGSLHPALEPRIPHPRPTGPGSPAGGIHGDSAARAAVRHGRAPPCGRRAHRGGRRARHTSGGPPRAGSPYRPAEPVDIPAHGALRRHLGCGAGALKVPAPNGQAMAARSGGRRRPTDATRRRRPDAPHFPQELPHPPRGATEHQPALLVDHDRRRQARAAPDPQQHRTSYDIGRFAGTFRVASHP